jgi:hypothetical protein
MQEVPDRAACVSKRPPRNGQVIQCRLSKRGRSGFLPSPRLRLSRFEVATAPLSLSHLSTFSSFSSTLLFHLLYFYFCSTFTSALLLLLLYFYFYSTVFPTLLFRPYTFLFALFFSTYSTFSPTLLFPAQIFQLLSNNLHDLLTCINFLLCHRLVYTFRGSADMHARCRVTAQRTPRTASPIREMRRSSH